MLQQNISIQAKTCIQNIYTSSLLHLQIPQQFGKKCCSFQWLSENTNHPGLYHNILTRFDVSRMNKSNEYQCTPLDFGHIIIGRVLVNKNGSNCVVKQVRYGPVTMQSGIDVAECRELNPQIKINFAKNLILSGNIKIVSGSSDKPNSFKFNIEIQAELFKFKVNIDQNIRLPSNNSFFKFYDKQEDSLGISVYHQHSQFLQKLKCMKNAINFGFYIKVCFQNRFERDKFLFQLLQIFGMKFGQNKQSLLQIPKKNTRQLAMVKSKESTHKQLQSQKKKQIDDQIFKLLYEGSQIDNQPSLDMADAQFLFSSKRFGEKDLKDFKDINEQKEYKYETEQKHQSSIVQEYNILEQTKQLFLTQKKNNQIQEQFGKSKINVINEKNQCQYMRPIYSNIMQKQAGDQNYLRNTITKLTNQIKNLMRQNRKLSQQNKKLRDENMRLRFKEIRNPYIKSSPDSMIKNKVFEEKQKQTKKISQSLYGQERLHKQKRTSILKTQTFQRTKQKVEQKSKSKSKLMKTKSFNSPNTGSLFIPHTPGTPGSPGSPKLSKNSNFPIFPLSHKQFIKQKDGQGNKYRSHRQLGKQRQSNHFHRTITPQLPYFSHTNSSTGVIPKFSVSSSDLINTVAYRK